MTAPELFYCECYGCRLMPERCLERQAMVRSGKKGTMYWRCGDCEQGRRVTAGKVITAPLETETQLPERKKAMSETRICADPECEHAGQPQPLSAFGVHGRWKTPMKICKACRRRRADAGREKHQANGKANTGPPSGKPQSSVPEKSEKSSGDVFLVYFADYPELMKRIEATAALELRTPKDQLLWMVKTYVSPMEEERANS